MLITEVIPRRTWQQVLAEATCDKNTHLEHLEDLILNNGYDGAIGPKLCQCFKRNALYWRRSTK